MSINLGLFFILAAAVAAMAWTVAKSAIFRPLRDRLKFHLFSCPWCMSFWFALPLAVYYQRSDFINIIVVWFALVASAAIIGGFVDRLIGWSEVEVEAERQATNEARKALQDLVDIIDAPYTQIVFMESVEPPNADDWAMLRDWYRRLTR